MLSIGGSLSNASINHINKNSLDNLRSAEKMTSGIRINRAADDAAGLAVSTGFQTILQSGQAVSKGINDGISYTQVANGALAEVENLLQRARELSLQSMNGTYTDENRAQMNIEYTQVKAEIDRIAETTSFNGTYPFQSEKILVPVPLLSDKLDNAVPFGEAASNKSFGIISKGSSGVIINFDSFGVDDDIQLFTRDGRHVAGGPLTEGQKEEIITQDNGFFAEASYSNSQLNDGGGAFSLSNPYKTTIGNTDVLFSGEGNEGAGSTKEYLEIPYAYESFILVLTTTAASGSSYTITANWSSMPEMEPEWPETSSVNILTSTNPSESGVSVNIKKTPVSVEYFKGLS